MTEPGNGVFDLLASLRERDIRVWAEEDRLRYSAPKDALDDALRARLRTHKADLLAFLREADGYQHTTVYIPVRDGVELAADVFRPQRRGTVVEQPLPVVWCLDRYQRSEVTGGVVTTKLDTRPWLRTLVANGYVVAVVDARGSGASTGARAAEFSVDEVRDGYDVTEWLAAQPWCTGRIGMCGASYEGIAQLLIASTAPPHLVAIFPEVALFDLYDFLYPGGVFRDDFARNWSAMVRALDTDGRVAPVDGQRDRVRDVLAEHRRNVDVFAHATAFPLRDSEDPRSGERPYLERSPSALLDAIARSGVAVHHLAGWWDMWVRDSILWFRNLPNPSRLVIGPWYHNLRAGIDMGELHLRWYDHWLKGVDTGLMDEPPIRYTVMGAPRDTAWRSTDQWPPPRVRVTDLYLGRPVDGAPGGGLRPVPPRTAGTADTYQVDYTATSGRTSRWANGYGAPFHYDLTENDPRALVYSTGPLPADVEITGHPVVHLNVRTSHPDVDFFVYLEEVDTAGESHYITEGVLRASHRATGPAPYDTGGLPYHPSTAATVAPIPVDEVVPLVLELHPTSNIVRAGRRIRLAVTCCDKDNASTPRVDPPPVVRLHHGADHPSYLRLPVMPNSTDEGTDDVWGTR